MLIFAFVFSIFNRKANLNNLNVIDEYEIEYFNNNNFNSFKKGINTFFDEMTISQAKKIINSYFSSPNVINEIGKNKICKIIKGKNIKIPENYDLRKIRKKCLSKIANQQSIIK